MSELTEKQRDALPHCTNCMSINHQYTHCPEFELVCDYCHTNSADDTVFDEEVDDTRYACQGCLDYVEDGNA